MGRMLIEAVRASGDCVLAGALDIASSPAIGSDATAFLGVASGVPITADVRAGLANADVLIDFTRPEGTLEHLAVCAQVGVKAVIGTTGFTAEQKEAIAAAAQKTAVVFAPNMSVGVNVTLKLLDMAARALSTGYDIEVIEAHHRHKVDAPSGTALKMGEVIAQALGRDLKDCAVYAAKASRGSVIRPPSASPPSVAATSWATTRCCSRARASVSRFRTSPPAARATPRAACAPRASWRRIVPGCSICSTSSA